MSPRRSAVPTRARSTSRIQESTRGSPRQELAQTSAGRTCSPSQRSSRARTSRRCSTPTGGSAAASLALAVAGAAGWGDQPSLDVPGVLRLGYTPHERAARSLSRRERLRLPVALRGFRHARCRGDGLRRAVRRLVACVARRGVRRRCRARRSARCRCARARDRTRARGARRARRVGASSTRARSPGSPTVARISRRGRLRGERRGRRHAARADARRNGALLARSSAAGRAEVSVDSPQRLLRRERLGTLWLDLAWYPHVLRTSRAARRCPALPDLSRAGAHEDAARRDGARHCGLPPPRGVPALDAHIQPLRRAARVCERRVACSPSPSSPPPSSSRCSGPAREDRGDAERGRRRLHG